MELPIKVLITGAGGYIGSKLVPYLLKTGYLHVTAVDNFIYGDNRTSLLNNVGHLNFRFFNEDVLNKSENMMKLMDEADIIIPLAAIVGFPVCDKMTKLTIDTNQKTIEWMVDYCAGKGKKFIFPTTNSGYGATDGKKPCTEKSPMNPVSHYGRTKVAAEQYIIDNAEEYVTLRLATVFGVSPRMRKDLLVNDFVWRAMKDRVNVIYQGHAMRNYVHINDVVFAFEFIINEWHKVRNQTFNLGNDEINCSKLELAKKIAEFIPHEIIEADFNEDPDKRNYIVSSQKLKNKGFQAIIPIEYEIPNLVKAYQMIDVPQYGNY